MKKDINMTEGPLVSSMIRYSIPIALTSFLQMLFNAADLVVVGRFCGSVSVAAVGATNVVTGLITNLFIGLSLGAGVCVAHAIGARDDSDAEKTVHTSMLIAFLGGLIMMLIGITLSPWMLSKLGTPDNVIGLSSVYLRIIFSGSIFSMIYNYGASILRAAGDTKNPLYFLTISGVLNVVLNVFFVVAFDLNVAGVALATIISQALSSVLVLRVLTRRTDACRFSFKKVQLDPSCFAKITRIGLPAGIQSSMFSISNLIIQSSVNSFGSDAIAGNSAAGNLEVFGYVLIASFSQAALNFIGQCVGAGKYDRIKKIIGVAMTLTITIGVSYGILFNIFGRPLLSIYISDSAAAINYGVERLATATMFGFICAMTDIMSNASRALGHSTVPMIISIAGICGVRLIWIYTVFQIPAWHTLSCLFISYPLSWAISTAAQAVAFAVIFKKVRKKLTAGTGTL